MPRIKDVIKSEIVEPSIRTTIPPIVDGIVDSYDDKTNTACVRVFGVVPNGETVYRNVPVDIMTPGMHFTGLFPGDHVRVAFLSNSQLAPIIVGYSDPFYAVRTRKRFESSMNGGSIPYLFTRR